MPARFGEGRPGRKACLAYDPSPSALIAKPARIIPSARHEPAIDVIGLAGDVAGARRSQEHRHRGDVVWRVGAADRDAGFLLGEKLLDRDAALGRARPSAFRAPSSVRVTPGQMALTLMLKRPSCCAAILVSEMTAPLLAA